MSKLQGCLHKQQAGNQEAGALGPVLPMARWVTVPSYVTPTPGLLL